MPERSIYLIRHGRTSLNAAGVLRGHLDPPLDKQGEQEAEQLGDRFARITVDHVIASPLLRAQQTALAVALPHSLSVTTDRGLIDRDYGQWAGTAGAEVERQYGSLDAAPGVESWDYLCDRLRSAFRLLLHQFASGTLVLVGHNAGNRALLDSLCPGRWQNPRDIPQPTAGWSRLDRYPEGWQAPIVGASPNDDPLVPAPGKSTDP